jgi:hypothetical protein
MDILDSSPKAAPLFTKNSSELAHILGNHAYDMTGKGSLSRTDDTLGRIITGLAEPIFCEKVLGPQIGISPQSRMIELLRSLAEGSKTSKTIQAGFFRFFLAPHKIVEKAATPKKAFWRKCEPVFSRTAEESPCFGWHFKVRDRDIPRILINIKHHSSNRR